MRALSAVVLLTVCLAIAAYAQVARFHPNQKTYSVGEPLMFTLEIKNSTPESIYLFPNAVGKCSDAFTFSMTGNSLCSVSWDPACSDDTVELPAGETYTAEWPLDFWYHVLATGHLPNQHLAPHSLQHPEGRHPVVSRFIEVHA